MGSKKPAKPFGAPVSDAEDEEDDNEGDEAGPSDEERAASPEKESEEKKKTRLQRSECKPYKFLLLPVQCISNSQAVEVDDGEAGEATIVSVRAKMFHHDKVAGNWKERGAGMLKINVPRACLEFDEAGAPIPGSFDASGLELDEEEAGEGFKGHKVARLLLRQDQTHRVILNTAILPAMKFQEKASLKSVGILFTAFEGEQATPVSITMKVWRFSVEYRTESYYLSAFLDVCRKRQDVHERSQYCAEGVAGELNFPLLILLAAISAEHLVPYNLGDLRCR